MADDEGRIFPVETQFQKLARLPGGVPRAQAIAKAQAHIDAMRPELSKLLDRRLQEMAAALEKIPGHPDAKPQLEFAYRSCCELRDIGISVGFELTTVVSSNLCKILESAIKSGVAYQQEMVDCHIEALRLTGKAPYCNMRPNQLPEMTGGLRRVVELATNQSD